MTAELFEDISDEKKRKILEAAFTEFKKNGYDATGTRAITKAAGVSTGLLFYYFKDKRDLFFSLCDILTEFMLNNYFKGENTKCRELLEKMDFFERFRTIVNNKMELMFKYSDIYKFLLDAYKKFPEYAEHNVKKLYAEYNWIYQMDSCFKDGVDEKLAAEIIEMAFSGLSEKYLEMLTSGEMDMDTLAEYGYSRTHRYLEFFRKHLGNGR